MGHSLAAKLCIFAVTLLLCFHVFGTVVHSMPTGCSQRNSTTTNKTNKDEDIEEQKIKVAKFDFEHIATPFIVTVWVLLASLLKVGKLIGCLITYFDNFLTLRSVSCQIVVKLRPMGNFMVIRSQ